MDIIRSSGRMVLLMAGLLAANPLLAQGNANQPAGGGAAATFEKRCYSCHNIGGGDKKGPDLIGLLQRRDPKWLHPYILSPKSLKNSGDPEAIKLFQKYAPEEMPDQVLSAEEIDQILDMIRHHSATNKTFIPKSGKLARKTVPKDIPAGRALFLGKMKLAKGGSSCISCHSVSGVGTLGGGTFGPDLTNANMRYTDVELASIIKAPAFPMMSRLFANKEISDEEVVQLFAFLQSVRTLPPDASRSGAFYLLLGAAGVLVVFGLINFAWRDRLQGVRKQLRRGTR